MPSFCSVVNCAARYERDRVSFFRFPAVLTNRGDKLNALSVERREAWIKALKRGPLSETQLNNGRVCSRHFLTGAPASLEDESNPDWIPNQNMFYMLSERPEHSAANSPDREKIKQRSDAETASEASSIDQPRVTSTMISNETITVKMEIDYDEEPQGLIEHDYAISQPDLDITVKEEPATDFLETEIKREEEEENTTDLLQTETHLANAVFLKSEPVMQYDYDINDVICPMERNSVEELLEEDPRAFCSITGLPNITTFHKIFDYVHEGIEDTFGISKTTQLFSVLTKLHTNIDSYYMDKYKFPATYVSLIDLLHEKLKIFWKLFQPKNPHVPSFFRNFFPQTYKTVVITRILQINVQKRDGTTFPAHYAVGFTSSGSILCVSEGYISTTDACDLLYATDSTYLFQRDNEVFFRNAVERKCVSVNNGNVIDYYAEVTRRLTDRFKVLLGTFPEYMLRKSARDVSFLYKVVSVCCALFNIVWLQQIKSV